MTAAEVLAAWQNAADAATEGPWKTEGPYALGMTVVGPTDACLVDYDDGSIPCLVNGHDAEFIALSRDALPRAVAALQAVLAHMDNIETIAGTSSVRYTAIREVIDAALGVKP